MANSRSSAFFLSLLALIFLMAHRVCAAASKGFREGTIPADLLKPFDPAESSVSLLARLAAGVPVTPDTTVVRKKQP